MKDIVLVLPLPPASLSPNGRAHVFTRARDARRVRGEAKFMARSALAARGMGPPRWQQATVTYTWRNNRGPLPDADNLIARCKPVLDGLIDAGILADDRHVTISARAERGEPSLIVTISPEGETTP